MKVKKGLGYFILKNKGFVAHRKVETIEEKKATGMEVLERTL